jgi:hypothetical protein
MHAQVYFQDLNFESANVSGYSPGNSVPVSDAFHGWSAYFSSGTTTYPQSEVSLDGISTGGAVISLIDDNASPVAPLQGNYSAFLFGGGYGVNEVLASASISQTATILAGTQSITMDAWTYDASPIVAINGVAVNMIPLPVTG